MTITRLDHVNLLSTRPEETIAFYEGVLGLEHRPQDRPDFGFPGAWLFLDDRPVVHVVYAEHDPNPSRPPVHHVAFASDDLPGLVARLDEQGIPWLEEMVDESGVTFGAMSSALRQIFLRDPNGVTVEVFAG